MRRFILALLVLLLAGPPLTAQTTTRASTTLLDAATTTSSGAAFRPMYGMRTYQVYGVTSSGSGSATVVIEVSNITSPAAGTNVDWITMGTVTLTLGTTRTSDGFVSNASWVYVRARVTAISGTGATVTAVMGN